MAIQVSPLFEGFSGSINCQLVLRQRHGKTIVSKFPDRSSVIYSENQKRQQRRFADAVSFARIVISDEVLFKKYSVQASLLGFRSAWNVAIAEYMSAEPLGIKPKKVRFEKSVITSQMGKNIQVKLSKGIEADSDISFNLIRKLSAGHINKLPPIRLASPCSKPEFPSVVISTIGEILLPIKRRNQNYNQSSFFLLTVIEPKGRECGGVKQSFKQK